MLDTIADTHLPEGSGVAAEDIAADVASGAQVTVAAPGAGSAPAAAPGASPTAASAPAAAGSGAAGFSVAADGACACSCNRADLPWSGRGTDLDITGCRFSLYPMTDGFAPVILGALDATDTGFVWSESDALSTVYRGRLPYVMDAVAGLFANAWREGVHMALEGQVSHGCPGDVSGDSVLSCTGDAPNRSVVAAAGQPAIAKLALYPLGVPDYIDDIAQVWYLAQERGLNPRSVHYATRVEGSVRDIFSYLEEACALMQRSVPHYVLHFTVSVNSPTEE